MIELPEAHVLATQISSTLQGKRIAHAQANASPHKFAWYKGDPALYGEKLGGRTVGEARAFGNYVEVDTGERMLVISTPIKYHVQSEARPKKHQLLIEFDDDTGMSCTVQMWGAMLCLAPNEDSGLMDYPIAKQKPSPLSDNFDQAYFDSLLTDETGKISAKEFLATKQRIPGLGNGVLQDILWTARIHPRQKMAGLTDGEREQMFRAVKDVLSEMTRCGGRDTERDLFGQPGGYKTILSKNTLGAPCLACGTPIKKESYMGGVVYTCEVCQVVRDLFL